MAVDLMQMNDGMDKIAASREHALAMTRDYISQPRLSKYDTKYHILYCLQIINRPIRLH